MFFGKAMPIAELDHLIIAIQQQADNQRQSVVGYLASMRETGDKNSRQKKMHSMGVIHSTFQAPQLK